MMKRRHFLKTTSIAALAPSLYPLSCNTGPAIPIIDTHQHLWDLEMFPLQWVKPPLDRNFLMEDYLDAVKGQGVVKTIYMEVGVPPGFKKKEAEWALKLCKDPGNPMVAAVISADPKAPDFETEIRSLAEDPRLKGIRYSFNNPEEVNLPGLIKNIRLLGKLGLSCDLNLRPRNLTIGNLLAEECTDTRFILNHCGGTDPVTREARHDIDQWYRDMELLAQQANMICKISGIVDNAGSFPLSAEDLAPIVDHCLNSFGPDRVIFGGDWPVCLRNMPLARWIEVLKEVVARRSLADQKKLFHDNAAAFYGV